LQIANAKRHGIYFSAGFGEMTYIDRVWVETAQIDGIHIETGVSTPLYLGKLSFFNNGESGVGAGLHIAAAEPTSIQVQYISGDNNKDALYKQTGSGGGPVHILGWKAECQDAAKMTNIFYLDTITGLFHLGYGYLSTTVAAAAGWIVNGTGNGPLLKWDGVGVNNSTDVEARYRGVRVSGLSVDLAAPRMYQAGSMIQHTYIPGFSFSETDFPTNGLSVPQDRFIVVGAGSPEGAITAKVGSLYLRTNGGANTSLYVKESGSGNTGWVAK
jgi:hypothetical protein